MHHSSNTQAGSIIVNSIIIILLAVSFVFISGYKKDTLFGTVYKSNTGKEGVYGKSVYGSNKIEAIRELKIENIPITCAAQQSQVDIDIDNAKSLFPHMMDIQENTIGSCAIHSIWHSMQDKLGKTFLKGGFRKDNIPLANPDGKKNISALEEIAKDTKRSIGSGSLNAYQMAKAYKNNGASKCEIVDFAEISLENQCTDIRNKMAAGYDCNLITYNQQNGQGHVATIDSMAVSGSSCTASVYDTTQQDPTKSVGRQTIAMGPGASGDKKLDINAPFSASMKPDVAGFICCK
ncbi:MAG: hypothetical protein RIQ72_408 [Candidatus Parcubacteria bacterium]